MLQDISPSDKKEIVQEVVDRLLYCAGYKKELEELNKKFSPKRDTAISHNPKEFKFSLDKAIP